MGEAITVKAFEGLPHEILAEARARIAAVAAAAGVSTLVEALRIRLEGVAGGVLAQVNAEVDGRRIRIQEAAGFGEALDRVTEALRERIGAVTGSWAPRPWPLAPRRGAAVVAVPAGGGPKVVRVKEPSLVWCSPEAATRTMDAMDYDIHLFTDPATETDAVVYRVGPTGYRLARTTAAAPPRRGSVPLTLSPCAAPRLSEAQAVGRLVDAELPFLFFAHPVSGRGRVLYRRFDGHLGLIAGKA
ncbi:sigma 54 modulation/S30EA ribosomal C-terminal domain-containing protein [Kitasatospora sp. NPDC097643]|uniref:sigma 54 modulation/S30EA ribosomal C-terminal domain-containing protein n=1 Tax=Kitasatospora sp. NPDC097643 TaxID=3157230 RepID=UPI00331DB0E4